MKDYFDLQLEDAGVPMPIHEYRFHPTRRWKFDYCWLKPRRVALEIEGGAWSGGRHTRGMGFINDMEKYNEAALLGWILLRATPQQRDSGEIIPTIKRALGL